MTEEQPKYRIYRAFIDYAGPLGKTRHAVGPYLNSLVGYTDRLADGHEDIRKLYSCDGYFLDSQIGLGLQHFCLTDGKKCWGDLTSDNARSRWVPWDVYVARHGNPEILNVFAAECIEMFGWIGRRTYPVNWVSEKAQDIFRAVKAGSDDFRAGVKVNDAQINDAHLPSWLHGWYEAQREAESQ